MYRTIRPVESIKLDDVTPTTSRFLFLFHPCPPRLFVCLCLTLSFCACYINVTKLHNRWHTGQCTSSVKSVSVSVSGSVPEVGHDPTLFCFFYLTFLFLFCNEMQVLYISFCLTNRVFASANSTCASSRILANTEAFVLIRTLGQSVNAGTSTTTDPFARKVSQSVS